MQRAMAGEGKSGPFAGKVLSAGMALPISGRENEASCL